MGANADRAAEICNAESGSDPKICGDKTTEGHPVSCGLFQINLTQHQMKDPSNGQTLDCPSAFDSRFTGSHHDVKIVDQPLYDKCVAAAQDPKSNIEAACGISKDGNKWNQWSTAKKCGIINT